MSAFVHAQCYQESVRFLVSEHSVPLHQRIAPSPLALRLTGTWLIYFPFGAITNEAATNLPSHVVL